MRKPSLRIQILSNPNGWRDIYLKPLIRQLKKAGHRVRWCHSSRNLKRAEITFITGFLKLLSTAELAKSAHNIVVHESRLPHGRGWSPMPWQVVNGADYIPIALFEAEKEFDSGRVYLQGGLSLNGTELVDELREKTALAINRLCRSFVAAYPRILKKGRRQSGRPTYYRKRNPLDSELNPRRSIAQQFDLLRICDPKFYPPFFRWRGATYTLVINKVRNQKK